MKKILFSMAAVSALAIGAPAAAQYSNKYQNQYRNGVSANSNVDLRIDRLQARIQAGVQSGAISRQEAMRLRDQLRQLTRTERQYSRNGLTGQERADLQMRMRNLREQIRYSEGRGQGRYGQGGYGQGGYENDNRYGNGAYNRDDDRNGRWDDDRDDRWDDDRNDRWEDGRGDVYQQQQRGGIGGIVDSIFGGNSGLRVGQRVSGNLYGVPTQYRSQFRDGNGVYYRSDGRAIYQIDARTQTVIRVFPMNR